MEKMKKIITTLQERGLIESLTSEEIFKICEQPIKIYAGFDPTADSLHIGNLVTIMVLAWFQRLGHTAVAIVGGATGMIGDPSGKSAERNLLDEETIQKNLKGIKTSLETVLKFNNISNPAQIFNNYDWFKDYSFIHFLRDIGKHFRVSTMLARDSVKSRMISEEGMSFTEFSYQMLQGFDFLHLYDEHGVVLQTGGSDQWGNIIAGVELIRKVRGQSAHGLTFPLLLRSDGKKFGKTEEGTIWLNKDKLSPYEFYQYFIRIPDADVIKLMRMLTFMDMEQIHEYESKMNQRDYVANTAQKKLAEEITRMIHGEEGLEAALRITKGAAPGAKTELNLETLNALAQEIPSRALKFNELVGVKIVDLLSQTQLLPSKSEARRLIANGGCYLNNEAIEDENYVLGEEDLIEGKLLLLSMGKKKKVILRILEN